MSDYKPSDHRMAADMERLQFTLGAVGIGYWEIDPAQRLVRWDARCQSLFNATGDTVIAYEQMLGLIHADDRGRVEEALQKAMDRLSDGQYDTEFRTSVTNLDRSRWLRIRGKAHLDEPGTNYRLLGIAEDITPAVNATTERRQAEQDLREKEGLLRALIEEAPVATGLYVGRSQHIEIANEILLGYWGKDRSVLNQPLAEALPELAGQPFLHLLDEVFTTGKTYEAKATPAQLNVDGSLGTYYFDFTYKPLRDAEGAVYGIMNMAVDVTEQVIAKRELEESELFARSLFENSPVAIVVFEGRDMTIKTINENMLAMLGRDASVIGQPFMEAMPELIPTALIDRLRQVLDTGEPYYQPEEKIELIQHGQPYTGYYNYIYTALSNAAGERYGIMVTATEVTQQVLARQQVEEAEASLRGAIELAELATWSLDIQTGTFHYSPRFMDWLGFSEATKLKDEAYNPLPLEYRQTVAEAIDKAVTDGFYDLEHPIVNRLTGQVRIIHAQAQVFYDVDGNPETLSGTAQDITRQRQIQLALEQEVRERTEELAMANEQLAATNEELAATNEELAASNEELMATNDDLVESNQQLVRSNDNLQRFAYVASHDLQEPLRKVQQFGDLLKNRYADPLGDGVEYLERMQGAASRMSTLIKDLLTFSLISTQQDVRTPVPLTQLVQAVVAELDLRIQETGALVTVDPLPTVLGDPSQLTQLFQNLLSNALKFRRSDIMPLIRVSVQTLGGRELPTGVKPTRMVRIYHRISVIDNGIGFDEKYLDRIFQVFQRLHGRSEFAGTGIGLAICEKVAANHGGAITATSQPGFGATFSVYLPHLTDQEEAR